MKNPWKKLSSKIVHQNQWYYIRRDQVVRPDGTPGEYNVMVSPASVYIVPVNEKGEVYLIGIFRYPTGLYSIEVPAGSTDGKIPLPAAKRELKEEAGLTAQSWKSLGKFQVANGLLSETGHVYLAQELKEVSQNQQREEGIEGTLKVPFKRALQMIHQGKITDAQTIVALTLAKPFLNKYL